MSGVEMTDAGLTAGATTTLTQLLAALEANAAQSESYATLARHIKKVANWQVRNVGSWAGNLVMARKHSFASDVATLMMGAGATLTLQSGGTAVSQDIHTFLHGGADMGDTVVTSITIPKLGEGEILPVPFEPSHSACQIQRQCQWGESLLPTHRKPQRIQRQKAR